MAVQDKITLNASEEGAIELKRQLVGGEERVLWNPLLSTSAMEFEFSDAEAARLRTTIETWVHYGAAVDRRWLEPLVEHLFYAEPQNSAE